MSSIDNKENQVTIFNEEDERSEDEASETGTERRTSLGGTSGMYTDSLAYGTGSILSTESGSGRNRSPSYASSVNGQVGGKADIIEEEEEVAMEPDGEAEADNTYTPSSQDNESARIMALLEPNHEIMALPAPGDQVMEHEDELQPPKPVTGEMVMFGLPSDSGLGTDIPTAALEDHEHGGLAKEYFDASNQDLGV